MKRLTAITLLILTITGLFGCSSVNSSELTNVQSILNSAEAYNLPDEDPVEVAVTKVIHIKDQKAYNNEYSYYIVQTSSHDWGYAEFCNGEVQTFHVGYKKSVAKTRCNDLAKYRLSKPGSIGQ